MGPFLRTLAALAAALTTAGLAGCDGATPPAAAPLVLAGAPADAAVSLDVFVDGEALHRLTGWARPDARTMTLRYDRSDDGGRTWNPATSLAPDQAPPAKAVHRGEDAQIAARGDTLMAVWPGRGSGVWGSGPLGAAVSHDRGATWSAVSAPPPAGADDDAQRGERFPALATDARGFHLVWIDARGDDRSVHYARTDHAGAWGQPVVVDAASCACCWNQLAPGPEGGLIFIYRDVNPRDMSAVVQAPATDTWSAPTPVGAFNWDFDGCPHVGAGLAVQPQSGRVHALVWSGKASAQGLHTLTSRDGGRTWSPPRPLGTARATHPELIAAGPGHLVAAWTESHDAGPALWHARSADGGASWSAPRRLPTGPGFPTHVRLTHARGVVTAHWTQAHDHGPDTLHAAPLTPLTPG